MKVSGLVVNSRFGLKNDILKVAGFGQICSNMHLLVGSSRFSLDFRDCDSWTTFITEGAISEF